MAVQHSQDYSGLAILFITYHFLFKKLLPSLSPPYRPPPPPLLLRPSPLWPLPSCWSFGVNEPVIFVFPGQGEKLGGPGLLPGSRAPTEIWGVSQSVFHLCPLLLCISHFIPFLTAIHPTGTWLKFPCRKFSHKYILSKEDINTKFFKGSFLSAEIYWRIKCLDKGYTSNS